VVLGGGNDIVALQQSTNPGPLGVPGAAKLKGGMDFDAGTDALVFDVADDRYWNFEIEGNVTGLESARRPVSVESGLETWICLVRGLRCLLRRETCF